MLNTLVRQSLPVSIDIFNCDPPSPPLNGYIDSYNRTAEGLTIRFVCQNSTTRNNCLGEMDAVQDLILHTAVCTLDGNWEPNLDDVCLHQGILSV